MSLSITPLPYHYDNLATDNDFDAIIGLGDLRHDHQNGRGWRIPGFQSHTVACLISRVTEKPRLNVRLFVRPFSSCQPRGQPVGGSKMWVTAWDSRYLLLLSEKYWRASLVAVRAGAGFDMHLKDQSSCSGD